MKPLISLDVFDTAIFRKVFYPTDIFNVVEDKVGNNFKALRVEAQRAAAKKNPFYNIIDIYKEMSFPFNPKEEIKAEYENCKANPYILEMYNKGEADYIFISDMYLPAIVIKSMLEKCGYKNPQVFVSCEMRVNKSSGLLFSRVEEKLNRKILKHIGDNYGADILGAQKARISQVEFVGPPIYKKEVITPILKNTKLRKFLIDKELSDASIEEKIGYQFAPLALAFTQYVLNQATKSQTIFFNARDSFILYVIARWILKTKKKIKYCRFSRRSNFIADIAVNYSLSHPNNAFSYRFFRTLQVKSLRDFLQLFHFNEKTDFSSILKEYGITLDSNLELNKNKFFILEKVILLIQPEIYKRAREEKRNFLKYIDNIGMKNNDIFVDSGYRGTLQGVIHRIANINVKGVYLTVLGGLKGNYYGYNFIKDSFLPLDRAYGGALLESIFTELKGTTVGYTEEGKPVLSRDSKYRKDVSKKIMRGVLRGCRNLYKENISASAEDCSTLLKRLMDFPTVEEALFGNQPLFENGSNEDGSMVWFNEKRIREGKLKECYNKSYWKSAFKLLLKNSPDLNFLLGELKWHI